jgi:flagellar hook protein FlgE
MMTQAFYTGLSGLRTMDQSIAVVSDNLANTSTLGYRAYNAEFANLFEKSLNNGSSSVDSTIGVGSRVSAITMDESRGVFQLSQRSTDLAILGDGWFGVEGYGNTFYTRDGSFNFDANRDLVTQDGYHVLGTMGGNIAGEVLTQPLDDVALGEPNAQVKLSFPKNLYFQPVASTQVSVSGNLNLAEDTTTISSPLIDVNGDKTNLRIQYTKSDPQVPPGVQWDAVATVEELNTGTVISTQSGVVSFDDKGALLSNTLTSVDNNGTAVSVDMGSGYSGLISIAAPDSAFSEADGIPPGDLIGYDINMNGEVLATFTNGRQSSVAQLAVFQFQNDQGLERINGTRFMESKNSGKPFFFKDENGQNSIGAGITTNKLEGSNVNYEQGLTDLIIMQRAFDANSKSITTADEMLQKALNMDA